MKGDFNEMTQAELPEALHEGDEGMHDNVLGEPLNVKQAAKLIGCSSWTLRNKLLQLPTPPPVFRSGPGGKLTFYRDQVTRWILERQTQMKGGLQ